MTMNKEREKSRKREIKPETEEETHQSKQRSRFAAPEDPQRPSLRLPCKATVWVLLLQRGGKEVVSRGKKNTDHCIEMKLQYIHE